MLFKDVGHYFSQIDATSSRLEITKLLAELLGKATAAQAAIICNLSLGQLNPPYIGTQFNIAEKSMLKIITDVLDVSTSTVTERAKKLGDLGLVIEEGTWRPTNSLTIHEVNKKLHEIEQISGVGSQDDKIEAMFKLIKALDHTSAKYVVRIVLGKLRMGFSDMTIIDALSWMEAGNKSLKTPIETAYNLCADIGVIASTLKEDGIKGIEKMRIHVSIPIRPEAAERLPTAKAVIEKLGTCVAQPKLDGFRLQIHIDNTRKTPKIHFFSRNLQDMSAMFPDIADAAKSINVDTIICEGEAIGYDVETDTFAPFQETIKRKRKHGIEEMVSELPMKVFLFDLMYVNGVDYLDKSHEERRKKLLQIFNNHGDTAIQVIPEKIMHTAKELEEYLAENIASGLEGLVVKKPDAIYQAGTRNFNWIKLKRAQMGHLEDTVDCVVLGYYAGSGKRAHFGIGAFLVGVYDSKKDCFETIAKVGTGLKDADWKEIKKRCDAYKVIKQPKNVICAQALVPTVWTSPDIVVQIKADEITQSPVHAAGRTQDKLGYALRFPRFISYREDKSPEEATSVREIIEMYKDQF
ncbi:MAG: ATP-dependent DNA ligase [Candidatus Babeliales bacterium]